MVEWYLQDVKVNDFDSKGSTMYCLLVGHNKDIRPDVLLALSAYHRNSRKKPNADWRRHALLTRACEIIENPVVRRTHRTPLRLTRRSLSTHEVTVRPLSSSITLAALRICIYN
jgi:hypothetical protein